VLVSNEFVTRFRRWTRRLKAETLALYFAVRDTRTPWHARLVAGAVVAYALSPIDLIPDFIPLLGYLDDLLLVPLGLMLAIRLIPAEVLADSRARAQELAERPTNPWAAVAVILIWLAAAAFLAWWLLGSLRPG
jgi:uncharacterized membrane protein YkvA (DUF1232 family)